MKSGVKNKKHRDLSVQNRYIEVCRLLNREKADYLVIGGVALSLHGNTRATKDIDFLIPKNVKNTERILKALKDVGFGIASEISAEEVVAKPFTIIGDIPRVDLITVANKVTYEDAVSTALEVKLENTKIPYVDMKTLIKTKQTGRPQDKIDIEQLLRFNKKKGS